MLNIKYKINKGAISIFALLSMMFFLIFIMAAYSNIMQKGKLQVETYGVEVDYYKKEVTPLAIISSKNKGNTNGLNLSNLMRGSSFKNIVINSNVNKYIYSNGGLYKIVSPTYQQVEYIEATGTQYIDTGYKPGPKTGVEVTFAFTGYTQQQRIFGVEGLDTVSNSLTYELYHNGLDKFAYSYKNGAGNYINSERSIDKVKHKIKFNVTQGYWSIDDGNVLSNTALSGNPSNTALNTMTIMAYNRASGSVSLFAQIKMYSFKIYENGTLIRNFVPCYRKSDNVIGMYDVVNDVFYTNSGTGTFVKGADV